MTIRLLISTVLVAGAAVIARPETTSARIAVSASFGVSVLNIGFLPFRIRLRPYSSRSGMQAVRQMPGLTT